MKIIKDLCLTKDKVTLRTLNHSLESNLTEAASDASIWQNELIPFYVPNVFKEK